MIDYQEGKTIYTVHGSRLLENYFESEDIDMMAFKNILTEITLKNREIDTFAQLHFVFSNLKKENRFLLGSIYLSYLSTFYLPILSFYLPIYPPSWFCFSGEP